jgi:PmbA protein
MENGRETARRGLQALLRLGADKAQCMVSLVEKHEMNVDAGEFSLLRTTFDTQVGFTAIKGGKKGQTAANKSDPESIDRAAADVLTIAEASQPDEANDIAESQTAEAFSAGSDSPDLDRMHMRLTEFLNEVKVRHPKAIIRQAYLDFTKTKSYVRNSNGVDFESTSGVYHLVTIFSSKEGDKVSSFNYTGFATRDLDKPLLEYAGLDRLLRESGEQTRTFPVKGKFVGQVIFTPECLDELLRFLTRSVSDGPMIAGTSIYKDSLTKEVTSPSLTIHSRPVSDEIADGYFVTTDGYKAENMTLVNKGVLKSYMLSLYGAKKTGKERAVNQGGAWVVEPGDTSFEDIVKSIDRGILLARFSGGNPSANGDFSGIAKNSYLIEDGKIKYPISESMISGNFAEMLMNVTAVSKERVHSGYSILPWVAVSGATISGK